MVLLEAIWLAMRSERGRVIFRNPVSWILLVVLLPVGFVLCLLYSLGFILLLPFLFAWDFFRRRSLQCCVGNISDDGIHFPNEYGRPTITWSAVSEVVRVREPKAIYYLIVCAVAPNERRERTLFLVDEPDDFEGMLLERGIPFRAKIWTQTAP